MFRHRHRHRKNPHHLGPELFERILRIQKNELTENRTYRLLAMRVKDEANRKVLLKIANEERSHAEFWKTYTGENTTPDYAAISFINFISRIFGLTFAVKFMELGENRAQEGYAQIESRIPRAREIREAENRHEKELLALLDEEGMRYVGSMVLGVNDALVELTGVLAGLTLALANGRLIAATGLITGIAASLSMAASEYLSVKAESRTRNPLRSAVYTGLMYIVTVAILILPFFIFGNIFVALGVTLGFAILIIMGFTFYISVVQDHDFRRRFLEMAAISLGVAGISFGIGYLVKAYLGITV